MMKVLILFTGILLFNTASAFGETKEKKQPVPDTSIVQVAFPKKVKPALQKLVSAIAAYGKVEGAVVGYAAQRSRQYERFMELSRLATDSQLVLLTSHYSAAVKAYAGWALAGRNYPGFDKVSERLSNDKQTFQYLSGCTGGSMTFKEWMGLITGLTGSIKLQDQ